MRVLTESFQAILETMDPLQRQIIMGQMGNQLPSGQMQIMKQIVEGGTESILPPTKDEVKEWKTFYLLYFNSEKSV